MQMNLEEKLNPDVNLCSEIETTQDCYTHLTLSDDIEDDDVAQDQENEAEHDDDDDDDDEDEDEDEEEEFSFMCGGANTSPIAAEDAFADGQIKPIFPLFNRDLFFPGGDLHEDSLPMRPPVKNVFVETGEGSGRLVTSSPPESDEASGPYCEWSNRKAAAEAASPEVCKKSNSTGFSKIWRFKDLLGRSNSDGRDAFVFLNNGHAPPSTEEQTPAPAVVVKPEEKAGEKKESTVKVKGKGKKGGKAKTTPLTAHEVYLKSKAKGEERRRSYLPYRPELMGFFTNVNGGLTKNVHPF